MVFTEAEIEYLTSERMGRLASIQPNGSIQNNPVVYWYNTALQTIDIGGRAMASTQKFRNVAANGTVSFVIDQVVSLRPWRVRGIEIRGRAEALIDQPMPPQLEFLTPDLIRIHPKLLFTWGINPAELTMTRRVITSLSTAR